VRFRQMQWLSLFLAVLFFANNASAAIGACASGLAGQDQTAVHALAAGASVPPCSQSDESGPCPKHYVQDHQFDDQATWAGVPAATFIPAFDSPRFAPRAPAIRVAMSSAQPVLGPPLTILYRNFRN